jgi:hypothetical protein
MAIINPELKISTRVKLKDGCEAVISDDAINQPFRMIDVGKVCLLKISMSEIDFFYILGNGWCRCRWQ